MIAGGGGGGVLLDYASTYLPAYLQLSSPLFHALGDSAFARFSNGQNRDIDTRVMLCRSQRHQQLEIDGIINRREVRSSVAHG